MTSRKLLIVVLSATLGASNISLASDDEASRKSLIGLQGVYVLVEGLSSGVERTGLNKAAIQTDAELKLRQNGVRVLSENEWLKTPGTPTLYINAVTSDDGTRFGYALSLELHQGVVLSRNPDISMAQASTWDIGTGGGLAVASDLARAVRDGLKDLVDQFINAYLSVNPKR